MKDDTKNIRATSANEAIKIIKKIKGKKFFISIKPLIYIGDDDSTTGQWANLEISKAALIKELKKKGGCFAMLHRTRDDGKTQYIKIEIMSMCVFIC